MPNSEIFDDVPVLVHVGLHKTGTTWLQQNAFQPRAGQEFVYVDDRVVTRGSLLMPDHHAFDAAAARAAFSGPLAEARAAGVPLLISDEALAGFPYHHKFLRGISLDRIAETFPGAQVLLTIREQAGVIYSVYGHYIRGGHTCDIDGFLEEPPGDKRHLWEPVLDRTFYDYDRLLTLCGRLFGPERVSVLPMEWMIANPEACIDLLRQRTAMEWAEIHADAAERVVNPAWSDLAYGAARYSNRLFRAGPRWRTGGSTRLPARMAYWADRMTPASTRKTMKARTMARIRDHLGDTYAESNRALSARIGLELGAYGYHTGAPDPG